MPAKLSVRSNRDQDKATALKMVLPAAISLGHLISINWRLKMP
jgi:hypothetical protein